jgi:hypothetical protein
MISHSKNQRFSQRFSSRPAAVGLLYEPPRTHGRALDRAGGLLPAGPPAAGGGGGDGGGGTAPAWGGGAATRAGGGGGSQGEGGGGECTAAGKEGGGGKGGRFERSPRRTRPGPAAGEFVCLC